MWNSVLVTGSAIGTSVIGFITLFVLTRIFSPEEFGAFVSSQAKVMIWLLLVDLGLYNGLIGTLTPLRFDPSAEKAVLTRALLLRLAGSLAGVAILFAQSSDSLWRDIAYTPFLFGYAIQQTFSAYLAHRGQQSLAVSTHLFGFGLSALLAIVTALLGGSVTQVLCVHSCSGLLASGAMLWKIKWEKSAASPHLQSWQLLFSNSWAYALIFASTTIWQRLDQITAARLFGLTQAGEYGLAARLVGIPILVVAAVSVALFPDFQRTGLDAPEKLSLYIGLMLKWLFRYGLFLTIFVLGGVAGVIVLLFPKFLAALHLLPYFVPGIWAFWLFNFANNGLAGFREYKKSVAAHLLSAGIYFAAIHVLPVRFGLAGIALSYSLFCVSLFLFSHFFLCRCRQWKKNSLFSAFTEAERAVLAQLQGKIIARWR